MNIPQLGIFKSKSLKAIRQHQNQKQYKALRQHYLGPNCHRTYSCIHCRAHLANHDELISKLFQGNHGRAYLFNKVVNVGCRQAVERELLTGLHAVADIYCDSCEQTLGWKYEQAFVPSQKYKEGKYIIELVHLLKENHWDLTSYNSEQLLEEKGGKAATSTTPTRTTAMRGRSNTFMNGTSHGTGFVAGAGTGSDSADPDDCDFDPYNSDKLSAIARPDYRSSFSINIGTTDDSQAIDDGAAKNSDNHEGGAEKAAPPSADTKASADVEQEIRPQCLEGSTTAETSCNEATATTRETIRIDRDGSASQGAAP